MPIFKQGGQRPFLLIRDVIILPVAQKISVRPFFQPIICVDSSKVFAYEVLGRKCSPQGIESLGPFFHNKTIPPQEKLKVDRVIRWQALQALTDIPGDEVLFLNIQPNWLLPYLDSNQVLPTIEYLEKLNISGKHVVIEIIENEFNENCEALYELVKLYRQVGCRIAVDDYGEGFSNLERIALLQPDFIKISASLFKSRQRQKLANSLLETIGLLCEKTGSSLVLEQVETMEEFILGLEAGVRYFQGFFFRAAQQDFMEPGAFESLVIEGLQKYQTKKITLQKRELDLVKNMNRFIKEILRDSAPLSFAVFPECHIGSVPPSVASKCLRLYICNHRGYQISPNYAPQPGGQWFEEEQYRGRNWSWRPYFLPKVVEALQREEGVMSQPYIDLETRQKIWTFVYPLDEDLFLFVDCPYTK
ncbi:MAG: EAL domain-containing protein [Syntrophomonas sp.]